MANKTIGTGLSLDGEREYKSALQGINTNLAVLGSELGKVGAQFGDNADSLESLTAKQDVFNRRADEQRKKVDTLRQALADSATAFGENDKKTKDWQIALNRAETDLAKTETALKGTTDKIDAFGKEAKVSGGEVEKAGNQARESGSDAQKGHAGWDKLGNTLSRVGKLAAKTVAAMGMAVGVATGAAAVGTYKMVMGAVESADSVQKLADVTGFTAETIQEFTYAGSQLDVELETITGSQTKLIKAMDAARSGGKNQTAAFDALGISVVDANGNLRDSKEVMLEAFGALGNVGNETERDALAMKIFGKSARELNPLIKAGTGELKKLTAEARTNGAVLTNEQIAALDKFGDSVDGFKLRVKGMAAGISVGLLPAFEDMLSGLENITDAVSAAMKTGDWDQVGDAVSEGLNGIVSRVSDGMPAFTSIAATVIGGLAGALAVAVPEVLPPLIDATMDLLGTLVDTLDDNSPMLVDAGIAAFESIVVGLGDEIPNILDVGLKIITELADGMGDSLPTLIPTVVTVIARIVTTLAENAGKMVPVAIKLLGALGNGLIASLPILVGELPKITSAMAKGIADNGPEMIESGAEMIGDMAVGVGDALPEIMGSIAIVIDAILQAFAKVDWLKVGGSIIGGIGKGLMNGLEGMMDELYKYTDDVAAGKTGLYKPRTSSAAAPAPAPSASSYYAKTSPDIYLDGVLVSGAAARSFSAQSSTYTRAMGAPVGR